ncbi:TspO protein [Candidatus Shapirobacteria bacterium CG10_big_fil_rev_8_21_14_0_10_38_14]|uniref:TspO protein n=1 Tax=Candidatus Shapirobacteria bacterium CG10_big_fil_rev_8_21_14_0_10_38_14 TaxID=1974483 RepID=A0A2M8L643_9BACT|nr:MAG: TspO protein [Candidatus Shapirobacteria bacterium CG10_big_fil_rev_8_21_14_0_10_38_14]
MKINNFWKLIISVLVCLSAGFIGSFFTTPSIPTWYATLNKPSFNPPNWLFGPVWTTLFILMGIAAFLIWRKGLKKKVVKNALIIFLLQLIFNTLWSFLFFKFHSPFWTLIDIVVLWVLILLVLIKFWKINKVAGILLIPYLLWVSFASFLNYTIYQLN